ncbi:ActD-like protein [Hyalangium versicolor]|uniref:ActD-like protein n=1 Tax=Hyalangium versicolor TaxID=2861190 RepID=UPI001CCF4264|nr:ActD-like protein [Hyalangium versicolor]
MSSPHRTPDWLLERIALGELPPAELAAARARLAQEPDGEARLASLEAENKAILETLKPDAVAREVESRAALARRVEAAREDSRPLRRFAPVAALVPALAVAALFVVAQPAKVPPGGELVGTGLEVTRTKGLLPQLVVHRQGASEPERLTDGAPASAGDVVQVSYVAAGYTYGVILSVDGRGAVTLHAPETGGQSVALAASGTHALPRAYELDDAPAFERFILVTADKPFPLDEVLSSAHALAASADARKAPLALPEGFTQTSFTLEKVSP